MKIKIPATSANLGPGFDCLGLALSLYNEVVIKPSSYQSISVKGEGEENVKLKKNNIFISIFNDIYQELVGKKIFFGLSSKTISPFLVVLVAVQRLLWVRLLVRMKWRVLKHLKRLF